MSNPRPARALVHYAYFPDDIREIVTVSNPLDLSRGRVKLLTRNGLTISKLINFVLLGEYEYSHNLYETSCIITFPSDWENALGNTIIFDTIENSPEAISALRALLT